ncbi:MAG: hypothetical protein ACW98D_15800, partial [Promethearchaeota archaeon]
FNIAGYFIQATNDSIQELATIDVSTYIIGEYKFGNAIIYKMNENFMKPNEFNEDIFDLPNEINLIYSIEVIPVRFQIENNRNRLVSCGASKVKEEIDCTGEEPPCVPESLETTCGTWQCGSRINNCNQRVSCGTCTGTDVCDGTGQCVPPEKCVDTCSSLGYQCDTQIICEVSTDCGTCTGTDICNETGQCISSCGNGICSSEEDCSCIDCEGEQAQCAIGEICQGSICVFDIAGFNSCGDYCALFGYSLIYTCQDNPNKCVPPQGPEGGIYIGDVEGANLTRGNDLCKLTGSDKYCCCIPLPS